MKESTSQHRIKELLDIYHITLSEMSRTTGVQKSALSNYIHGTRDPRQDKIAQIADAYGINPAWLMGYDVPMHINKEEPRVFYAEVDTEELLKAAENDRIAKAIELYNLYESADPNIREAIDSLLKVPQFDFEHLTQRQYTLQQTHKTP